MYAIFVFLPKIGLYYVVSRYRIKKKSTLQTSTSSTSIIFDPVKPSPTTNAFIVL